MDFWKWCIIVTEFIISLVGLIIAVNETVDCTVRVRFGTVTDVLLGISAVKIVLHLLEIFIEAMRGTMYKNETPGELFHLIYFPLSFITVATQLFMVIFGGVVNIFTIGERYKHHCGYNTYLLTFS